MNEVLLHPSILRAYDIRGIWGETLNFEDAIAIGRAFAACLANKSLGNKVIVGRDGRLSSPKLAAALIEGLVDGGAEVLDIGCGPTPMLYFAAAHLGASGAIQVTGSHNPPMHNGFKMVMNGKSFFGDEITNLGALCAAGVLSQKGGKRETLSIFDDYVNRILQSADAGGLSVVWDCGNGASGPVTDAVVSRLTGQHEVLFSEVDGTFPNHHPNPVDSYTLEILRAKVKSRKADIGIGFDGDGDRIGVIDAKGRQVPGDLLTVYLAQDVAKRHPGRTMLLDIKSSQLALDMLSAAGINAAMWKTGHSHMKKKMAETGSPLAGEMSGHIFISDDYFGFDDAIYVALRILTQMVRTGQSITAFMDGMPDQHATPELRVNCADDRKFTVMEKLQSMVAQKYASNNINTIDGVRVTGPSGWWLVRASNTEAALIARAEATCPDALDHLILQIETALSESGLSCSLR